MKQLRMHMKPLPLQLNTYDENNSDVYIHDVNNSDVNISETLALNSLPSSADMQSTRK